MGIHKKRKQIEELDQSNSKMYSQGPEETGNPYDENAKLNLEIPIDDPNQIVLHKEMLLEANNMQRDVKLVEKYIDFNFC